MGTRGFAGFVVDGVEKLFVNHKDALVRPAPGGVPDQVRALRLVADCTDPTPADIERIRNLLREHAENASDLTYADRAGSEELLEAASYDLDTLLQAGIIVDGSELPADSLFCEWGYLIDLDTATFEVYRGFQTTPHAAGRFAHRPPVDERYRPVALIASWPLAKLPAPDRFLDLTHS